MFVTTKCNYLLLCLMFLSLSSAEEDFMRAHPSRRDPKVEMTNEMTTGESAWLSSNNNAMTFGYDAHDGQSPEISAGGNDSGRKSHKSYSGQSFKSEAMDEFIEGFSPLSEKFEVNRFTKIDKGTFAKINNQAHDGSIDSAYFLALIHFYGLSTNKPDYEEARRWFKDAAVKGHTEAQCALGILLYDGVVGSIGMDKKTAMVSS